MSHLEERVNIACPLAQAASRLARFFQKHGNADGDRARLNLGIDVEVPGLPISLALQRSVIATIQPHHLPADMTPRYNVEWAPETPGPFPLFRGELVVEGMDDYDSFRLLLTGDYTPPLGVVGKSFDAAVGHRVAQATAHDLLDRIRILTEEDFGADEAAKGLSARIPEPS